MLTYNVKNGNIILEKQWNKLLTRKISFDSIIMKYFIYAYRENWKINILLEKYCNNFLYA